MEIQVNDSHTKAYKCIRLSYSLDFRPIRVRKLFRQLIEV